MKILMFHVGEFWYKTYSKTLDSVDTLEKEAKTNEGIVVFIHVEKEDEDRESKLKGKALEFKIHVLGESLAKVFKSL
jgi:hypothetical protein